MLHSVQLRCCHEMHVANSTKCNCILPYAYVVLREGNVPTYGRILAPCLYLDAGVASASELGVVLVTVSERLHWTPRLTGQ